MNEECEAVKTTLWAEAPTVGWPPSLRSEIFNVRRRWAPSSHVSNEHTQNPMAGKIRDDWWVRPSHGEASGLCQPRFWIRVFLLDRLPAKANEPCLPHTHTHTHNRYTALWILPVTTQMSQYQKKHSPPHSYRGHQSSLIRFLQLLRSMTSSLFNLCGWQYFSTISPSF